MKHARKNKHLAKLALNVLRNRTPAAKLSFAYETLAQLSGYRDWNTAAAADVNFEPAFEKLLSQETV